MKCFDALCLNDLYNGKGLRIYNENGKEIGLVRRITTSDYDLTGSYFNLTLDVSCQYEEIERCPCQCSK